MINVESLTEEKIFTAATDIFEEKGMSGARMQDIANKAGINKALLHYYFRTKEKLFLAVFEKLAGKMFKKFASILQEDMPIEEKIEFFFSEHIGFLQKNTKLPVFILVEIGRNPELLTKFLTKLDLTKIKTSLKRNDLGGFTDNEITHLLISIVSLSVFPIAAKPVIEGLMTSPGFDYNNFIEERKKYSSQFVIGYLNSIKKQNLRKENRDL